MREVKVGQSGLRVSRLGLGTLSWGRETDGDEAAAQLAAFVHAGGTLVDSSPSYGDGAAQRVLAEVVGDVVARDRLVLSTSSGARRDGSLECSRRNLLAQLDATLHELGTDFVDLWQIDGWDELTPVDEVASALEYAVTTGRVRYVGAREVSGWQLATLSGALAFPLTVAQTEYSLLAREAEAELIPAAVYHGAGVFASAPLAGGVLTGKYRDGIPADSRGAATEADSERAQEVRAYLRARAARVVEAVVTAADGLATSPLSVALAWARERPAVAATVVGARDVAQLTGVLDAEVLELPSAIAAALDDVSGSGSLRIEG